MFRLRRQILTRCTAVALVAILVGQFAVAGHAAVAEHGIGEQCDICVSGDRLAHGLTATVAAAPAVHGVPVVIVAAAPGYSGFEPRHGHARAPPRL